jgi:hypothetical protein
VVQLARGGRGTGAEAGADLLPPRVLPFMQGVNPYLCSRVCCVYLPERGAYLINALVPTTSEIKLGGQEREPLQRETRLSFHVTPADTHGPRPRTGVLMLCLCLVLLFPRWKHLRRHER